MEASVRKKRLGRGLAQLIGDNPQTPVEVGAVGRHRVIAITCVRASVNNPRRSFSEAELDELASSIREKGLVQPLLVRPIDAHEETYELVAGERRWRASQRAGLHEVPVIIRTLTDREALELAIIENVQRADLNAIEEAAGYHDLIERFDYTQDDLAKVIGKSRSYLANSVRLLRLPDAVQTLVRSGRLSAGHARALIGREDAELLARRIVEKGLNVRDVEKLTKATSGKAKDTTVKTRLKDADTRAAEAELEDALGLTVAIMPSRGEAGELRIRYTSLDQLEFVRRKLVK